MNEQQQQIVSLLHQFASGEPLDSHQHKTLTDWMNESAYNAALLQKVENDEHLSLAVFQRLGEDKEQAWKKLADRLSLQPVGAIRPVHRIHFIKTAWFRYAAAIVLIWGIAAYLWTTNKKTEETLTNRNQPLQIDIAPGGNKAMLTLSDGSIITLDNAANGAIARQGNAAIIKLADGQIAYNLKGIAEGEVLLNTMRTPRGGQYQLTLPDGTKVWLNAASAITYPAAFVGKERNIKITGEAYFEVAKNKEKPFIVDVDGKSSIEVLGTHFNINSYPDESSIKTTLLEGSIKVMQQLQEAVILQPGQQAEIVNNRAVRVINKVDVDKVMAWKNGFFSLEDADLKDVMKQLERWYDIQVKYEGELPKVKFKGKMNRGVHLSDVLKFLSDSDVQLELQGRTLIVN